MSSRQLREFVTNVTSQRLAGSGRILAPDTIAITDADAQQISATWLLVDKASLEFPNTAGKKTGPGRQLTLRSFKSLIRDAVGTVGTGTRDTPLAAVCHVQTLAMTAPAAFRIPPTWAPKSDSRCRRGTHTIHELPPAGKA